MKSLFERLPEGVKNISTLIFGNSFGALFPLLLTPFLTRVYTESEFGIYTTYVAVVGIFFKISSIYLGAKFFDPKTSIIFYSIAGSLSSIYLLFWIFNQLRRY